MDEREAAAVAAVLGAIAFLKVNTVFFDTPVADPCDSRVRN